jgi:hypothetical protein
LREAIFKLVTRHTRQQAEAHCDAPCGVYDPAAARIAAEAVLSMTTFSRPTNPARVNQIEFVPAYQTYDFYASGDVPVSEGRLTLQPFFEINNLANFIPRGLEYADGARVVNTGTDPTLPVFREPGRVFQGGFRIRF